VEWWGLRDLGGGKNGKRGRESRWGYRRWVTACASWETDGRAAGGARKRGIRREV